MNGTTPRQSAVIVTSGGAAPPRWKSEKPKGGARKLVRGCRAISTASRIGSTPIRIGAGVATADGLAVHRTAAAATGRLGGAKRRPFSDNRLPENRKSALPVRFAGGRRRRSPPTRRAARRRLRATGMRRGRRRKLGSSA
jgi:hypothetical protein